MTSLYEEYLNEITGKLKELQNVFGLYDHEIVSFANKVAIVAFADIEQLSKLDPAAHIDRDSHKYVFRTYRSAKAILYYRIANALYYDNEYFVGSEEQNLLRMHYARKISELAKIETNVEIHPAAKIGAPFRIDHGFNTRINADVKIGDNCHLLNGIVIGETCELGYGCSVSDGVVMGSIDIENNKDGKRHPTIGNNVTISADVRILGSVHIGDNVFICPKSVIIKDIPNDTKVSIINQLQLANRKSEKSNFKIYGVVPDEDIAIYGANLKEIDISIIDDHYQEIPWLKLQIKSISETKIVIKLEIDDCSKDNIANYIIQIKKDGYLHYIIESIGLKDTIEKFIGEKREPDY